MAITQGTPGSFPIDFGISEGLSNLFGAQIGRVNPLQNVTDPNTFGANTPPAPQALQDAAQQQSSTTGGAFPIAGGGPGVGGAFPVGAGAPPTTQQTQQTNPLDIQPTGVSQEEIDAQFNPIFDVFNQAESNLRSQQPGLISEAEAQAQASRGLLEGGKQTQEDLLGQQTQRVTQTGQRQTADQRRILQELGIANQQRFGGASSAGLAASELQGREFQRSRAGIQQNVQTGLQDIDQQMRLVTREFEQGIQQLEVNKQTAINDINRRFQDKMLEISARRGETESAKQQARLGALQELRNQAFQINVARAQFEQDLKSQAQQNTSLLTQAQQNLLGFGQAGTQAGDTAANFQTSPIPGVESQTGSTNPQLTGQIKRDDEFLGGIPS